jgi:hypothetical protein
MIDLIESDGKKYLIYSFNDPAKAWEAIDSTKHLFLKAKDKPIVVIDGSFEGGAFFQERGDNADGVRSFREIHSIVFSKLHEVLSEYKLDRTVFVYGDANIEQNYINWCKENNHKRVFGKCIYRPYTLLQRSLECHNLNLTQPNLSFKPKHFICLNAVPRPHRFEMVNLLYENDWQHKGHISWLRRHQDVVYPVQDNHYFNQETLQLDFDRKEINIGGGGIHGNQLLCPPQYREACFDIVNETIVSDSYLFITDKTWKPILQKTPFIIFGSKNSHKHLEEYFGIKPYTDLFDYRFDNLDYEERFASIKHDNLERLLNMDIHELNEIVNSDKMQELLEYNKAQLLSHIFNPPKDTRLHGLSNTMTGENLLTHPIVKPLILLGF